MHQSFVVGAILLAGLGVAGDRIAAQQDSNVPDIEGAWVRLDTAGAGSFGGFAPRHVQRAREDKDLAEKRAIRVPVAHNG